MLARWREHILLNLLVIFTNVFIPSARARASHPRPDAVQFGEGDARTSVGGFPGLGGALGACQLLGEPSDSLPLELPLLLLSLCVLISYTALRPLHLLSVHRRALVY
jgi:hypothetical protein